MSPSEQLAVFFGSADEDIELLPDALQDAGRADIVREVAQSLRAGQLLVFVDLPIISESARSLLARIGEHADIVEFRIFDEIAKLYRDNM